MVSFSYEPCTEYFHCIAFIYLVLQTGLVIYSWMIEQSDKKLESFILLQEVAIYIGQ